MQISAASIFKNHNYEALKLLPTSKLKEEIENSTHKERKKIWKSIENPDWFIQDLQVVKKVFKALPSPIFPQIFRTFVKAVVTRWGEGVVGSCLKNSQLLESSLDPLEELEKLLEEGKSISHRIKPFLDTSLKKEHIKFFVKILAKGEQKHLEELFFLEEERLTLSLTHAPQEDLTHLFFESDPSRSDFLFSYFQKRSTYLFEKLLSTALSYGHPTMEYLKLVLSYVDSSEQANFLTQHAGRIILNFVSHLGYQTLLSEEGTKKGINISCKGDECTAFDVLDAFRKNSKPEYLLHFWKHSKIEELEELFQLLKTHKINVSYEIANTHNVTQFSRSSKFAQT